MVSFYDWCIASGKYGQDILNAFQGTLDEMVHLDLMDNNILERSYAFKCMYGHTFEAKIGDIIKTNKLDCKQCNKSLYNWCINNGEYGREVESEYTGIKSKGPMDIELKSNKDRIDIHNIEYNSERSLRWECKSGHVFYGSPLYRVQGVHRCPMCLVNEECIEFKSDKPIRLRVGNILLSKTKLYDLCKQKKSLFYKNLLVEWTGMLDIAMPNNTVNIQDVMCDDMRGFIWRCSDGHYWRQSVYSRLTNKNRCLVCLKSI